MESVPSNIDQWISSNTQLLDLLEILNREYYGDFLRGKDTFASFLRCITHAPNLQPLGRYHALKFWNEIMIDDERRDILTLLRDSNPAVQRKGIANIYALFKFYIPVIDPPIPFAVPMWRLFDWTDEGWKDMAEEMNDDSLRDVFPSLSRKIRIPANMDEIDWDCDHDFISTACSRSEGQDVSADIAKDILYQLRSIKDEFWSLQLFNSNNQTDPAIPFRSFFSSPVFGNEEQGVWRYRSPSPKAPICPVLGFFYPVKHGHTWLHHKRVLLDWYAVDVQEFPGVISNTVSCSTDYGEYQLCYQSLAILYIARIAIAEIVSSIRPPRVSIMALYISHSGIQRYIFSFCSSHPGRIQYWHRYFDFGKLEDLARLWLELWNFREVFSQQLHGFSWWDWIQNFEATHYHITRYPCATPSSSVVIHSGKHRSHSHSDIDPSDLEQKRRRLVWLNSFLRKRKCRVDKFIHGNVAKIVHWTTLEAVEYAKFFFDDCEELSIHNYLLSLPYHPHNHTVPISYFKEDPEGCTVGFTPNVGERLSPAQSAKELLDIALQICQAVNFMHQHGIAHLDLKKENIMVSSDNRVTIIDFSCAFHIPPPPGLIQDVVGTYGYMAPEVKNGFLYDPVLADIYSLGWVFEDLGGITCFVHFSEFLQMTRTMKAEDPLDRPSLSTVISHIEALIAEPSLWEHLGKYRRSLRRYR